MPRRVLENAGLLQTGRSDCICRQCVVYFENTRLCRCSVCGSLIRRHRRDGPIYCPVRGCMAAKARS